MRVEKAFFAALPEKSGLWQEVHEPSSVPFTAGWLFGSTAEKSEWQDLQDALSTALRPVFQQHRQLVTQ